MHRVEVPQEVTVGNCSPILALLAITLMRVDQVRSSVMFTPRYLKDDTYFIVTEFFLVNLFPVFQLDKVFMSFWSMS